MRRMYSKGQIKGIANGYRHYLKLISGNVCYHVYATLPVSEIKSVTDIPAGLYIGLKDGVSFGFFGINFPGGLAWNDENGSHVLEIDSVQDTLLD